MKNVFAKGSFIVLTLLFAAAFGLFAAWRMKQPRPADADLAALGDALQASGLLQSSKPGSARECRKSFGLSSDSYEEILYFSPMTFMDVEEVLVVRAPEGAEAAAEAMRTRLSELHKIIGIFYIGLSKNSHPITLCFKNTGNNRHAEARVIHVGVARNVDEIHKIPA